MSTLLMDQVAALPRNPRRFHCGIPGELAGFQQIRDDSIARLAGDMRKATRFLLTDEMVKLAVEFGEGPPARLSAAVALVRAPAEFSWFEWDEHARQRAVCAANGVPPEALPDAARRTGLLLRPSIRPGAVAAQVIWPAPGGLNVTPSGFAIGFGNPDFALDACTAPDAPSYQSRIGDSTDSLDAALRHATRALLGPNYCDRWPDHQDDLQRLAGHGLMNIALYGGGWVSLARRQGGVVAEFASYALSGLYGEIAGDYRFILSVLAVMQAAGDAVEVGEARRRPASDRTITGTPMTHHVIRLKVGAEVIRRRLAEQEQIAREGPRWHAFRPTRCYSRKRGNPACAHVWHQPDPGRDFHLCPKCDMRSWPRAGGFKGDKARGTVEQTFVVGP